MWHVLGILFDTLNHLEMNLTPNFLIDTWNKVGGSLKDHWRIAEGSPKDRWRIVKGFVPLEFIWERYRWQVCNCLMLEGLLLDHWRIVEGSLKDRSWLEASLGQRCGDTINFSRQRHVVCNWQDRQWIPGQLVSHRPLKGSCKNHRKRWSWKMVPITRGRHAMRINDPGSKNPERIPFIQAWSIFGTLRDRLGSFGIVWDGILMSWGFVFIRLVLFAQCRSISSFVAGSIHFCRLAASCRVTLFDWCVGVDTPPAPPPTLPLD